MMPDREAEILEQLDREASDYRFPMLNNSYLRGADVRLTVFNSKHEWLIIFQQIGIMEDQDFVNGVSAFGNEIDKPGPKEIMSLLSAPPGSRIRDENGDISLNKWNFTVIINGQLRHFAPVTQDYEHAGVDVDGNVPEAVQIIRLLAVQIPEDLFLPDDELLRICGRSEVGLSKFLQLDDWHHPDVADDELPSQSPCLRSLAHALAQDDPALYTCPEDTWNTHWSNWDAFY